MWSKYSLTLLRHPAVPRTVLLSAADSLPADLSRLVLKPLFSFGGRGVVVSPTSADLAAIPQAGRSAWCLQEKVEYATAFRAVDGAELRAEIRMMFLRPDDEPRLRLAQNLVRLSPGPMMGVGFNRGSAWAGSSLALFPAG